MSTGHVDPGTASKHGARDRFTTQLVPTLGLFTATMLVMGGVIGSGIFRKPGVMAAQVGSPELLLLVWIVAGAMTLFGALTIAELAAMMPETGGQYVYFNRIYGRFFGFVYGWAVFAVIQTGSIAAVAYVFAEYAAPFVSIPDFFGDRAGFLIRVPFVGDVQPLRDSGVKALAALAIILLTAANYIGVRCGGAIQNVFTVAKIGAMTGLVLLAFLTPGAGDPKNLTSDALPAGYGGIRFWALIAAALQGAFWAYDGWAKLPYIAGEVKNPQRNVPRALLIGMLAVTGLYVSINVAYLWVLPVDQMANSRLVAADVAEKCMAGGAKWIAAAVMLSTFGAANAMILASARVYFAMAREGLFPAQLGAVHARFQTPSAALVVQAIWSILLLFSGTFDTLTDTLIFVTWIFYAAGGLGVIILRRRLPDAPRPYKVPGYPIVPAVFVGFALLFLALTVQNDFAVFRAAVAEGRPALLNCALGLGLVLVGTPIYVFYTRRKGARKPPAPGSD